MTPRKKLIKKGNDIAKAIGCEFTEKTPDNGFGGYGNGTTTVWLDEKDNLRIVATCGNCGDGTWINVPF